MSWVSSEALCQDYLSKAPPTYRIISIIIHNNHINIEKIKIVKFGHLVMLQQICNLQDTEIKIFPLSISISQINKRLACLAELRCVTYDGYRQWQACLPYLLPVAVTRYLLPVVQVVEANSKTAKYWVIHSFLLTQRDEIA